MIVSRALRPVDCDPAAAGPERRTWSCLARRGMLHSETETFDLWRLPPGERLVHEVRDGVEEALFILSGTGTATRGPDELPLSEGSLLLARHDSEVTVTAGPEGLRLLSTRVLPRALSTALPARVPQLD
ncbi:cupin domain-containing protein [Kitasatospora sp. NPDC058032]|uniref:cupin domain-containing protein n=1 Tax=unclassified Kitasatospora TaxID=2633591 RepID=UPI0033A4448C